MKEFNLKSNKIYVSVCEITEIVEEGHQKMFGNCCDDSVLCPDQISYFQKP